MKTKVRNIRRKLISIITAFACLLALLSLVVGKENLISCFKPAAKEKTEAHFVQFIDVGQGDCVLISSNGRTALIDTGTYSSGNNTCIKLNRLGIKQIDIIAISHLHSDHTGGLERVVDNFKVKNLLLPTLSTQSEGLNSALYAINALTKSGGGVYTAVQGMNFNVGEFEITVLAAFEDENENNRSLMLMAEIQGKKFLFTGDAEKKAERKLLEENLNLDCDVYKSGHHGSNTSNDEEFLRALSPDHVAISVGQDNMYGHPHDEIITRIQDLDAKIYRTDIKGDITFVVNNGEISAKTEK